jgi:hypothetical protein
LKLAGSNTTEATTTSTGDLATVASLTIAAATPIQVRFSYRKATGAAAPVGFGLKLNTTEIFDSTDPAADTSSDNSTQSGLCVIDIGPRVATYLRAGQAKHATDAATPSEAINGLSADVPTATITDVVVTVLDNVNSLTAGVDEVFVYTLEA